MRNTLVAVKAFFLLSLIIFVIGCSKTTTIKVDDTGATAENMKQVIDANNQFAFDLYSKYKASDKNIFFSPYSISTAISMVYEGANGQTAEEIQKVFHMPKDGATRRPAFAGIYNELNKQDKEYQLSTANALWAQKDYVFLNDYLTNVEKYYGGKATNLDFVAASEKSRETINTWVEDQTNNKIKDLIPSSGITPLTRLVITNAIYFKGKWVWEFDKSKTKETDFRISPTQTVKVQMMTLTGNKAKFNYAEDNLSQTIELPYNGKDISMYIILPQKDDLNGFEKNFTLEKYSMMLNQMHETKIPVYIPRFKIETKYFMANDLIEMGMPTAFDAAKADFSGMTGKNDVYIGSVIHQAYVDVNEEGTEAAAATGVAITSASFGPSTIFYADHPFIFTIQNKKTGEILFIGRVINPNE
jgi:serpin B